MFLSLEVWASQPGQLLPGGGYGPYIGLGFGADGFPVSGGHQLFIHQIAAYAHRDCSVFDKKKNVGEGVLSLTVCCSPLRHPRLTPPTFMR